MPETQSLTRQITDLRQQNQRLGLALEQIRAQDDDLYGATLHNDIVASLLNERFNPGNSQLSCAQLQTRFLQHLSLQCHSASISIYQLAPHSGYFQLESYFSRKGFRPKSEFIAANAPAYISNSHPNHCNFAIAPMRFATDMNDIHWYYDKTSGQAMLISYHRKNHESRIFSSLTAKLLRIALQLYQDIQIKQDHQEQLHYQSTIDPLTRLPNRNLAFDRLGQAMRNRANENKMVFALLLDIAHFKDINETFGHDSGDQILIVVADRVRQTLRQGDTVARLSGDEFLIILENANKAKAAKVVAKNVINAISTPLVYLGRELLITSNIGIAAYPGDGDNASMLIKHADLAMHQAKKTGVNQFQFFTTAMNEEVAQRLAIETGLQKALKRNEFTLLYQPLVEMSSGSTVTVEALLRWHSPELGEVRPDDFIAIAEEDGFIIPVGYWVIEEVCRQLNRWKNQGIDDLTVAINLSVRQLYEPGFVACLTAILRKHHIANNKIELEITEGMLLSNARGAADVLKQLHHLGFKLSLDDFGTGYSALSYLNNYHFDYLKIDRSFITRLVHSEKDKALIDAIVAMAHKLNLKVVAEGVENIEELDYLQAKNCDYVQGFYFSKPVPAAQISESFFVNSLQSA